MLFDVDWRLGLRTVKRGSLQVMFEQVYNIHCMRSLNRCHQRRVATRKFGLWSILFKRQNLSTSWCWVFDIIFWWLIYTLTMFICYTNHFKFGSQEKARKRFSTHFVLVTAVNTLRLTTHRTSECLNNSWIWTKLIFYLFIYYISLIKIRLYS